LETLYKDIALFIQEQHLCASTDRILVAISGGPDSVFLAFALQKLGYEIGLAHVNFQLRGEESDAEETLVRQLAEQWQVPIFVKKVDTKAVVQLEKKSTQEVARQLRYDFFEEMMEAEAYDRCALAHQADDQSEQAILSLMLGNASSVLQQIPVRRDRYIRPLLGISRAKILAALAQAELPFATDSSNLKNDYLRNRVRNVILPELEQLNAKAASQLRQKQQLYASQKAFLDQIFEQAARQAVDEVGEGKRLSWEAFIEQWGEENLPLFVAFVLEKWGLHGHRLWQGVALIQAQVGKKVEMGEAVLERTRTGLVFAEKQKQSQEGFDIQFADFEAGKSFLWGNKKLVLSLAERKDISLTSKQHFYLAIEKLHFPLHLRAWQQGDVMQPLGLQGRKKISDIFVDEKFDTVQKRNAFVLEDKGGILLLSDFRIADRVKLSDQSQQIGVIFYE